MNEIVQVFLLGGPLSFHGYRYVNNLRNLASIYPSGFRSSTRTIGAVLSFVLIQ